MKAHLAAIAIVCVLQEVPAVAQHIDILVWDDGGTLGVGEYDFLNAVASERRVQIGRFDDLYSVDSPGFIALTGADALPGREDLTLDFLPMTVDSGTHTGYRSTILYWDGSEASPDFGPTATDDYEFSVFAITGSSTATGASSVEPGSTIATTAPNGSIHEHPFFYLDDDGDGMNTTLPAAGIYVVALELAVDGLEPADPIFMVWATPELEILPAIQPAAAWVNARVDTLVIDTLAGDYNANGTVDAADYAIWLNSIGQTGSLLAADGNSDEVVDALDYAVWRDNFGATSAPLGAAEAAGVPEPSSLLLLMTCVISVGGVPRRTFYGDAREGATNFTWRKN